MHSSFNAKLQRIFNDLNLPEIASLTLHNSGHGTQVYKVTLLDGQLFAVKAGGNPRSECNCLNDLISKEIPTALPRFVDDELLILDWVPASPGMGRKSELSFADELVRLHRNQAEQFGYKIDTYVGGIIQEKMQTKSWGEWFVSRKLEYPLQLLQQPEISGQLLPLLPELRSYLNEIGPSPRLVHGDLWTGNILCDKTSCIALIDPALYYGDAHSDLAMLDLFHCVSEVFWNQYQSKIKIHEDYQRLLRPTYQLGPLLVHCILYPGQYTRQTLRTIAAIKAELPYN